MHALQASFGGIGWKHACMRWRLVREAWVESMHALEACLGIMHACAACMFWKHGLEAYM